MRKKITIDGIVTAFASAIGYGLGYAIPEHLGYGILVCLLVCLTVGSIPGTIAGKVIFSKHVQEKTYRRVLSFAAVFAAFFLAFFIGKKYFNYNLFTELPSDLGYEIVIPIVVYAGSLFVRYIKAKKIKKKYGDGKDGFRLEKEDEEYIKSLNGSNGKIEGEYDPSLSVKTENGIFVCEKDRKVRAYLGIPYAKPPVGQNRWKAPQPVESSEDVYEAKYMGPSPVQVTNERNGLKLHRKSEDCLYLNVWSPVEKEPNPKKNVVVYIHGGDFTYGGAAVPLWHGRNFVEEHPDSIFVSFNYRVGLFGFIDFSGVPGGEQYPESSNLGILDQIEALRWIQRNISAFGGDPDNVTVMGDSSGAISIEMLSLCPAAAGLFRRAVVIAESPEIAVVETNRGGNRLAELLMEEYGAASVGDLLSVSEESLAAFSDRHLLNLLDPSFDGVVFKGDPYRAYAEGASGDVEFIFVLSKNEVGIYNAVIGEGDYAASMKDRYIRAVLDKMESQTRNEVESAIAAVAEKKGQNEAERWFADCWFNMVGMLRAADALKKAGKNVRCLYWDTKGLIEKFGSGSVQIVGTLLENREAAEVMGSLVDDDNGNILHALIGKYISGMAPELTKNEIKGVNEIVWNRYPELLKVTDEGITCRKELEEEPELMRLIAAAVSMTPAARKEEGL